MSLAQSTARTVMLKLFLDTDHVTAATGKTVAITISKAGGAFANPNAGASNATEVSSGWYKFALDTTDTNTLGDLVVRGTNADCDDAERILEVVSATTGGATNLDATVSSRASQTSLDTVDDLIDLEVAAIKTVVDSILVDTAEIGVAGAGLTAVPWNATWDAEVESEVTDALNAYDSPTNAEMVARTLAAADYATATALDTVDTEVGTIKAKTDQLTFTNPNSVDATASIAAADIRAAIGMASADLDDQLNALPTAVENADTLLNRDMSTGADDGSTTVRTVRQALRFLRNKFSIAGGTLTVCKEDDTTASWTAAVTTTAGDPVSAVDPAGP
jgi:hypothetical protein